MPPEQNLTTGRINYDTQQLMGNGPTPAPTIPIVGNKIREIQIRQLSHGYIVVVDSQTIAIESASKLVSLLSEYIYHPIATEQKYNEGKLI